MNLDRTWDEEFFRHGVFLSVSVIGATRGPLLGGVSSGISEANRPALNCQVVVRKGVLSHRMEVFHPVFRREGSFAPGSAGTFARINAARTRHVDLQRQIV